VFKLDNLPAVYPLEVVRGPQRFTIMQLVNAQEMSTYSGQFRPPLLARTNVYDLQGRGMWESYFEPEFLLSVADLIYRTFGKPPSTHLTVGMTYTPPAPAPRKKKRKAPQADAGDVDLEKEAIKRRMLAGR